MWESSASQSMLGFSGMEWMIQVLVLILINVEFFWNGVDDPGACSYPSIP